MLKKSMKIVSALMALFLIIALTTPVFATLTMNWDNDVKLKSETTALSNRTQTVMGQALNIVQIVGMGVAVIMLIVLAIKYISAAPGDKAEIKKHAVVYIVGAVVLFGAAGLLEIIQKFAQDNIKV